MAHRGGQERLGVGLREGAGLVEGNRIAQHHCHIIDLGSGGGILRQGLHTAGHHDIAEGTTGGDFFRAGLQSLLGAEIVDAGAELFLHEHAGTAGATAEGLVTVLVHLAQFHAGGLEQLTRRIEDLIVAAEEARIVVGNGLAILRCARHRLEQALADQSVKQLGVVEDVEVPVKVWVLIADGIKAVRASGDDLALALWYAVKGVVKGLDVLLRHHLEEKLVAGAAGRVTRTGLASGEHAKLHACGMQQVYNGAGGAATIVIISASAAHPEQVFHIGEIGLVFTNDGDVDAIGASLINPGATLRIIPAPRIALVFHIFKQAGELGREVRFREHLKAAQVRDVVDVLNIGWALIYARTAVGTRPQHIVIDDPGHRQYIQALMRVVVIQCALTQVHHDLFGAQRFLGIPCRA